mmetsp:Transcript_150749/g.261988  ORF Transcript_150749/g.261988 Transcript_150749/m.261988 type:complete len:636 (-) Transcript_150749:233-2140(-)
MTALFIAVFVVILLMWKPPHIVADRADTSSKSAFRYHLSSTTISTISATSTIATSATRTASTTSTTGVATSTSTTSVTSTTSTTSVASIFHIKHVSCLPDKPSILERSVKRSKFCPEAYEIVYDVETTCSGAEYDSQLSCQGTDVGLAYFAHSTPKGHLDSFRYSFYFDCVRRAQCQFTIFNLHDRSFQRFFLPSEARTEAELLLDIQSARKSGLQIKKPCTGSIMNAPVSTAQLASLAKLNVQLVGSVNVHDSFDFRRELVVQTENDQEELHLAPLCSAWHSPLPTSGAWVSSECLPHCRPGYVSQWLQDKYIWHPHGCRLQYVSHDDFLRLLKDLGIAGILFFGDSRQVHLHNEFYEFLDGKSQMPGSKPPPNIENGDFGNLAWQFFAQGYCRNGFKSAIQNVSLMIAETWGEVADAELVPCFEGDDLENRTRYVEMRNALVARPGLSVIERSMSLLGPEVDLVIWTAGLHNARCSLSNEVLLLHLKLEASIFKDWALRGLRSGKNRTIIYREEVGIYKTYPSPCVSNERLMSINRMALSVVQDLDHELREHTPSQRKGGPVQARALYLGAMMEMSMSRLDRIYDFSAHFYPGPRYQNSWQAFPRLVNSEMLLLLVNALQRLAAGLDDTTGLA